MNKVKVMENHVLTQLIKVALWNWSEDERLEVILYTMSLDGNLRQYAIGLDYLEQLKNGTFKNTVYIDDCNNNYTYMTTIITYHYYEISNLVTQCIEGFVELQHNDMLVCAHIGGGLTNKYDGYFIIFDTWCNPTSSWIINDWDVNENYEVIPVTSSKLNKEHTWQCNRKIEHYIKSTTI